VAADLPLLAETSGKNAMIVMPSADLDLAASDLVKSAFGHAGQKCSAASLAILVGPVARSSGSRAAGCHRSLRVGAPSDPRSEVGPVIEPPRGKLEWALTTLEEGEQWLVEPRRTTPAGVRRAAVAPGHPRRRAARVAHAPRGVLRPDARHHARRLARRGDRAAERRRVRPDGGPVHAGPADLALWLDEVQAGNLYVNRGITGAIVQRQPFGGWKRSSVGAGTKAGGPNYLVGLGSWRPSAGGAPSSTLHLRGLDSRITALIESAQPSLDYEAFEWLRRGALSDAVAWDREFGRCATCRSSASSGTSSAIAP
jgi:RHH-type proline utilization regulon transcriptional repressor/proline dehydrogenase/delta 1-pyrroline-5-carboxylate dehydrogenase